MPRRSVDYTTRGIAAGNAQLIAPMNEIPLVLIPAFFVPAFAIGHLAAVAQVRARERQIFES